METINRNNLHSDTVIEIMTLSLNEMQLIKQIRNNLRFGELTIIVRDGIPVRLKRITEVVDLSTV